MDTLVNSQVGLRLAGTLARATPPRVGHAIASFLARFLASQRRSRSVRAVRANQWVVAGSSSSREALDQAVGAVFQNAARSIYDLYHAMQDPATAGRLFIFDPPVDLLLNRPEFGRHGLVVVGLHMSSFDLALQWMCMKWFKPLVLTLPDPQGGRRLEFEIRRRTGMNLIPASVNGMRQAIRHLRQGGIVLTGIDRPHPEYEPRPHFFGRPACLPTHHIYLALKARVPVLIVSLRLEGDGKYHIGVSAPVEMDFHPERMEALKYNAEKVLTVAEELIRRAPSQWAIFQPVWPEAVDQAPG
jgi:lauroyl/myristoyl acyltransferase